MNLENINYKKKYLKYKDKYLNLKNSIGGDISNGEITRGTLNQEDILNNTYLVHAFDFAKSSFSDFFEIVDGPDGKKLFKYKTTNPTYAEKYVHTSWGTLVLAHLNGQWDHMDNAVIVPLGEQKGKINRINPNDTMILESLTIKPDDSYFVVERSKFNALTDNEAWRKQLQDCGFNLIEYDKYANKIGTADYDSVIRQIAAITTSGDHSIEYSSGDKYDFKLEVDDYIYHVFDECYNTYNDKIQLLSLLKEIFENNKFSQGMELGYIQLKSIGFTNCEEFKYNIKQLNTILRIAYDIIFKSHTLRNEINNIDNIKNSFINTHCITSGNIEEYQHPTPCFVFNNKNYNIFDNKLKNAQLSNDNLQTRQLVGRHLGFSKTVKPGNFMDAIQYLSAFDDMNLEVEQRALLKSRTKKAVLGRKSGQFPFSDSVKQTINDKYKLVKNRHK